MIPKLWIVEHSFAWPENFRGVTLDYKFFSESSLAQYALESSSQPLGISEYELEKFYLEKLESTIPTIKEIGENLKDFLV